MSYTEFVSGKNPRVEDGGIRCVFFNCWAGNVGANDFRKEKKTLAENSIQLAINEKLRCLCTIRSVGKKVALISECDLNASLGCCNSAGITS